MNQKMATEKLDVVVVAVIVKWQMRGSENVRNVSH